MPDTNFIREPYRGYWLALSHTGDGVDIFDSHETIDTVSDLAAAKAEVDSYLLADDGR